MSYYNTIDDDLARAKAILAKGGTIFGADTFAAYKLLESFVVEIERLRSVQDELQSLFDRMAQIARGRTVEDS